MASTLTDPLAETSCDCERCKAMCRNCPCIGTPEEIQAIIAAEYSNRLMLDWKNPAGTMRERPITIEVLRPAIVGSENDRVPFWPQGVCTFLDQESHCILHQPGLKPLEGRLAYHDDSQTSQRLVNRDIVKEWDSDTGRQVVAAWKQGRNFTCETALEYVQRFFPEADDRFADFVLFELTSYPFETETPISDQLRHVAEIGVKAAMAEREDNEQKMMALRKVCCDDVR